MPSHRWSSFALLRLQALLVTHRCRGHVALIRPCLLDTCVCIFEHNNTSILKAAFQRGISLRVVFCEMASGGVFVSLAGMNER